MLAATASATALFSKESSVRKENYLSFSSMRYLRPIFLALIFVAVFAPSAQASDADILNTRVNAFWSAFPIRDGADGNNPFVRCFTANTSNLTITYNQSSVPYCVQIRNVDRRWFEKGLQEEIARINDWKSASQKKIALRATRLAFYKAQIYFYNTGSFQLGSYTALSSYASTSPFIGSLTFADSSVDAATRAKASGALFRQFDVAGNLRTLALAQRGYNNPTQQLTPPPANANPSAPRTRPKVYWLSRYMLQEVPTGSGRSSSAAKNRANAAQRLAARYLDRAVATGLIIDYKKAGKPVVAGLPQNPQVNSRLFEICASGLNGPNGFVRLEQSMAAFNIGTAALNTIGSAQKKADNSPAYPDLGTKVAGMLRLPRVDIANAKRYFRYTTPGNCAVR